MIWGLILLALVFVALGIMTYAAYNDDERAFRLSLRMISVMSVVMIFVWAYSVLAL